jgi:hypothetical protein
VISPDLLAELVAKLRDELADLKSLVTALDADLEACDRRAKTASSRVMTLDLEVMQLRRALRHAGVPPAAP